jgi:TRAP-type C4-dicarboxylate transport system permease small subunit
MSTSGYCAPPRATTNAGAAVRSGAREPFALRALDRLAEATVLGALLVELLLVLANVIARIFFRQSFLWSDEVARLALSILAFIGGAVAYRRRDHAQVRLILNLLPRPAERVCLALADVLVFFVGGLIGIASIEFIAASWAERTPILQAPAALIALPLPVGTALMSIYAATRVWRENGRLERRPIRLNRMGFTNQRGSDSSCLPDGGRRTCRHPFLLIFAFACWLRSRGGYRTVR